eukprot:2819663-Pyramimonas_sp.AAC.3
MDFPNIGEHGRYIYVTGKLFANVARGLGLEVGWMLALWGCLWDVTPTGLSWRMSSTVSRAFRAMILINGCVSR